MAQRRTRSGLSRAVTGPHRVSSRLILGTPGALQFLGMGDKLFDLTLHMGTLFVVLWFYRNEVLAILKDLISGDEPWLQRSGVRMALFIVVASIPTGVIGLTLEDVFERTFSTPSVLIVTFALTGTFLYASKWAPTGRR